MYYIGLDVHKQKISYCVKDVGGKIYAEGWIPATRFDLDRWMKTLPQPWSAALEATMFSGWIYDHLKPHAAELKVARPLMLRASGHQRPLRSQAGSREINVIFAALISPDDSVGFGGAFSVSVVRDRRSFLARQRSHAPQSDASRRRYLL
jgi:hypothetical protein